MLAALAVLVAAATGGLLALSENSSPSGRPPAPSITAAEVADTKPTDAIAHVYVPKQEAEAVRAAAAKRSANAQKKASASKGAAPKAKPAELGPGGIPAASAGTNGSYKPPTAAEAAKLSAKAEGAADVLTTSNAFLVSGTALAPSGAPSAVNQAIGAANAIVGRPYVWGGGHGTWNSRGYDCSGAVSYALGGAGLLDSPLDSSHLEKWGRPGPGRWITVYANPGHAYAVIAGLRWDTVGDLSGTGPRWHSDPVSSRGYVARHPPGL